MKYGTNQERSLNNCASMGVDQNTFELSQICILAFFNFSFANGSRDNL